MIKVRAQRRIGPSHQIIGASQAIPEDMPKWIAAEL
jgi:hypothetical protein